MGKKDLSSASYINLKVAIIGAGGKMGRWFAEYLLEEGLEVYAAHSSRERLQKLGDIEGLKTCTNIEAAENCDVLVLSVPMSKLEEVALEIASHTRAGQLIVDVSSVKVSPLKMLHGHIKNGTVFGVHPMFGPGAKGIKGQSIVLTPQGRNEKGIALKVQSFLQKRGVNTAIMTPAEHDRQMSVILALSHFIAHVSADTIADSGISGKNSASFGTTFKALLTLVSAVLSEDPDFYAELQMSLPGASEMEKHFVSKSAQWTDLVKKGNKSSYSANLSELKEKFDKLFPGYEDSYEKMYRVVGE